jgi:DNA-binding MarR family transcriptional regulator
MSDVEAFQEALRQWAELLMQVSMRGLLQFARDANLSVTQLSVLLRLYYQGPQSVSSIGERIGVTNAATSQLVTRLVEDGYLTRSEGQADRRIRQITLTKKGLELIQEFIDARFQWIDELGDLLTPIQIENIVEATLDLSNGMHKVLGDNPKSGKGTY